MAGKILALFHYFSTSQSDDFFFYYNDEIWTLVPPLMPANTVIVLKGCWIKVMKSWSSLTGNLIQVLELLTIMRLKLKPMIMMTKVIMLIITAILLLYTVVLLQAEMPSVNVKCLKMHVRFFVLIFFSKKFILPE